MQLFSALLALLIVTTSEACLRVRSSAQCSCTIHSINAFNAATVIPQIGKTEIIDYFWNELIYWSIFPPTFRYDEQGCVDEVDCGGDTNMKLFMANTDGYYTLSVVENYPMWLKCLGTGWNADVANYNGKVELFAFCTNGKLWCPEQCPPPIINSTQLADRISESPKWKSTFSTIPISSVRQSYIRKDTVNCFSMLYCAPGARGLKVVDPEGQLVADIKERKIEGEDGMEFSVDIKCFEGKIIVMIMNVGIVVEGLVGVCYE